VTVTFAVVNLSHSGDEGKRAQEITLALAAGCCGVRHPPGS
jgi:hypothetical protein